MNEVVDSMWVCTCLCCDSGWAHIPYQEHSREMFMCDACIPFQKGTVQRGKKIVELSAKLKKYFSFKIFVHAVMFPKYQIVI